jgi:hypothetical protein
MFLTQFHPLDSTAMAPPETGSNSTMAGSNSTMTGGTNSTGSTANGVDPIDITAAENGGVTAASGTLANNSVGLDIEANDVGCKFTRNKI